MDLVLLWFKKTINFPRILRLHRLILWAAAGSITSGLYANPFNQHDSSHHPTPVMSQNQDAQTVITQAIAQAKGRVLIWGDVSPLMSEALAQNPVPSVVHILLPVTWQESQAQPTILTSFENLKDQGIVHKISFLSPHIPQCQQSSHTLRVLVDRHVYKSMNPPQKPSMNHSLIITADYIQQKRFLERFIRCSSKQESFDIHPFTYATTPKRRPRHLSSSLPSHPKWMERLQKNTVSPSRTSHHQPRKTQNQWTNHHQPITPTPHKRPHHSMAPPKKSPQNLWYDDNYRPLP